MPDSQVFRHSKSLYNGGRGTVHCTTCKPSMLTVAKDKSCTSALLKLDWDAHCTSILDCLCEVETAEYVNAEISGRNLVRHQHFYRWSIVSVRHRGHSSRISLGSVHQCQREIKNNEKEKKNLLYFHKYLNYIRKTHGLPLLELALSWAYPLKRKKIFYILKLISCF